MLLPPRLRSLETHRLLSRERRQRRRRLRPTVLTLESRELLSMLTVSSTNDSGTGSLRAAVNQANSDGGGDTIVFSSLFNTPQTITLTSGQLELTGTTAPTTITGPAAGVTVSGNNASRVFQVDSGVTATISGLTISGGNAVGGNGGGLQNLGTVTVSACTFTSNSVSAVSISGTVFGGLGGGLYNNVGATATVSACSFTGNFATPVSISGTLINGVGGGLFNFGTATVSGSTFTSNSASNFGGGLNNAGTATVSACSFTSNSAPDGGGLANVPIGGTATVIGCTFTSNSATNSGGGLFNNNTATVIGSTFTSNSATNGGGIANNGTATVSGSTFTSNFAASGKGGGIDITGSGESGNLVQGNFIGTDAGGANLGNTGDGITIDNASNNTIGGTTSGAGNVIAFNTLDGISLNDASNNRIIGNVVSGNGINQDAAGINLESNDSNNIIAGNKIGTNAAGTAALGNSLHGIFLGNGSSNNTIGGPTVNDRNVISGNGGPSVQGVGVYLDGTTTQNNSIVGNFIGTNAAGTAGISASSAGVLINNAPDNVIGGTTAADRNIISGNSVVGVYIALAGATENVVQNNYIGTDVRGLAGIPNGVDGIYINGAPHNTIGGTAPGTGNLISSNLSAGIQIFGAGATNNQILRNSIGLDANGRLTLRNGLTGIFSQISIRANDFGFSTVNRNLGQVTWQSPSSIGGGTVSGASQAAVAADTKASRTRNVSGHHRPFSKRKAVIVTAVHSYPNAKLALGLSRKSPASGRVKNLTQVAHSRS